VYDVVILPDGTVREREPGKGRVGSHSITRREIETICEFQPDVIMVGTGQSELVALSVDAREYVEEANLTLFCMPSSQAVKRFNQLTEEGKRAATLIHITC
jgi:hypothetical protein